MSQRRQMGSGGLVGRSCAEESVIMVDGHHVETSTVRYVQTPIGFTKRVDLQRVY